MAALAWAGPFAATATQLDGARPTALAATSSTPQHAAPADVSPQLGSVNAGVQNAPHPPLLIQSVEPTCGEQHPAENLLSAVRDEVRVRLTIKNDDESDSQAQSITVTLYTASNRAPSRTLAVPPIPKGGTLTLSARFRFPTDEASSYVAVSVSDEHQPLVEREPIAFTCVRKCPAVSVVTRHCRGQANCNEPGSPVFNDVEAIDCAPDRQHCERPRGPWLGKLAACSKDRFYCSYTRQVLESSDADGSNTDGLKWSDEDALAEFAAEASNNAVQVDCSVVGAQQAEPLPTPDFAALADATAERLGVPAVDEFLDDPGNLPMSGVTLAVLDTAAVPFDSKLASQRDNSDHGRIVGLTAHRVACGDEPHGACSVEIENRLALPILQLERKNERWFMEVDHEKGGYLASRSQIAEAVHSLLRDWRASAPVTGPTPLVINLSVGWHSKFDCSELGCGEAIHAEQDSQVAVPNSTLPNFSQADGDGPSHSFGSEAVLIELAKARCLGALIFAAAGNAASGNDTGSLLPAGYNRLSAAKLDCSRTFGIPTPPNLQGGIVTSVAGIDFDGERSALTRLRSIPHLVAPSVGLVTPDARLAQGVHTSRSGSSLATAVVSGAAARLWSLLGSGRTASEVLAQLYGTGTPTLAPNGLTQPAQVCAGPICSGPAREINACTPLEALFSSGQLATLPAACPVPLAPPPALQQPVHPQYAVEPMPQSKEDETALVDPIEGPWVLPQPWGVVCATCTDINDLSLLNRATDDWQAVFSGAYIEGETALDHAYYRFTDAAGNIRSVALGVDPVSGLQLVTKITGSDIPSDQCTRHRDGCYRVSGTGYFYDFNPTGLAARLEAEFVPVSSTSLDVTPLGATAVTRGAATNWAR